MRNATNIRVEEMIAHIVDPHGMGSEFSKALLPLEKNEELREHFSTHIARSLKNSNAIAAHFKTIKPSDTSGLCKRFFDGEINFIESSRNIAEILCGVLEEDKRRKGGSLVFCSCSTANYPDIRILALLKIDPSKVFRFKKKKNTAGEPYIDFIRIQPDAFFTLELQKCAFIRPLDSSNSDFELILLDTQISDHRSADVAKYFKSNFLNAEEIFDPTKRTKILYENFINALNEIRSELTDEQFRMLNEKIESTFSSEEFDMAKWLSGLHPDFPSEAKDEIEKIIKINLPDSSFPIDTTKGKSYVKTRSFKADYGLKFQFYSVNFNEVIESEENIRDEKGNILYRRIVIKAKNWERL